MADHLKALSGIEESLDAKEEEQREAQRKAEVALALPNQPRDWEALLQNDNRANPRAVRPLMGDIGMLLSEHKEYDVDGTTLGARHKARLQERRGPYCNSLKLVPPTNEHIRASLPPDLRDVSVATLRVLHRVRPGGYCSPRHPTHF